MDGGRITASRAATATHHHFIHIRGPRAHIAATPQIQFGKQSRRRGGADQSPVHSSSKAQFCRSSSEEDEAAAAALLKSAAKKKPLSYRTDLVQSRYPMMPPRTQRESEGPRGFTRAPQRKMVGVWGTQGQQQGERNANEQGQHAAACAVPVPVPAPATPPPINPAPCSCRWRGHCLLTPLMPTHSGIINQLPLF